MYRNNAYINKQSGSAIVIAIFVILVVSMLGAALASLQKDSATGTSYEVYAARAYLSAYTGSEIALAELFPLIPASASGAVSTCSNVSINPTLPANDVGFHNCRIQKVECTSIPASAGIATRYKITSTAVCENSQTVTRRQITVEATEI